EIFEPRRRLLVSLPEQAEQGIEHAPIGTLNDLDSNVDSCRTAPEFFLKGMPAGTLQRGKVGFLAASWELDDGARKADHAKQSLLLHEPLEIRGVGSGKILPDQQGGPQHTRPRFEGQLQREQSALRVDASQHPDGALIGAR